MHVAPEAADIHDPEEAADEIESLHLSLSADEREPSIVEEEVGERPREAPEIGERREPEREPAPLLERAE